jgi:hypothetical protein
MRSYHVHYKNKYPDCRVQVTDDAIDVVSSEGEHLIAMRKNGYGAWVDKSEEFGLSERHDLTPICKESRLYKCNQKGHIVKDELFEERSKQAKRAFDEKDGYHVARSEKDGLKSEVKVYQEELKEKEQETKDESSEQGESQE